MKFDENAFAYESSYNPLTFISSSGSALNVVGLMTVICDPLFSGGMDATDGWVSRGPWRNGLYRGA